MLKNINPFRSIRLYWWRTKLLFLYKLTMGDTRHSSTDSDRSENQPLKNLTLVRRSQIEAIAFNTINKLYKHDDIDGFYFIFNKDLAIL